MQEDKEDRIGGKTQIRLLVYLTWVWVKVQELEFIVDRLVQHLFTVQVSEECHRGEDHIIKMITERKLMRRNNMIIMDISILTRDKEDNNNSSHKHLPRKIHYQYLIIIDSLKE